MIKQKMSEEDKLNKVRERNMISSFHILNHINDLDWIEDLSFKRDIDTIKLFKKTRKAFFMKEKNKIDFKDYYRSLKSAIKIRDSYLKTITIVSKIEYEMENNPNHFFDISIPVIKKRIKDLIKIKTEKYQKLTNAVKLPELASFYSF